MEQSILLRKNPWWKGKEHFQEDQDYRKWKEKKIKWEPRLKDEIGLDAFALHFLFGPRQVGKTTTMKLIIEKLLKNEKIKSEQIFYFRCDELKDYKELHELLEAYFSFREQLNIKNSYIFLDEITFADEWFRTIKGWIDEGKFNNDVILISGSATLEIKKHREYFPGRKGKGKNYALYPLSFREFIKIMDEGLYTKLGTLSSLKEEEIKEKASKSFAHLAELNKLFVLYLKIGGFPLAINSYAENKEISFSVKETYISWIKSDLAKIGRDTTIAREIIKSMINKIPSPMSWEGIAKETSIKSPKTINAYIHIFEEIFLLAISSYMDLNALTAKFGKNKKIHLADPLFYELFEEWCLIDIKDKDNKKAENILAYHLLRFAKETRLFDEGVFYWQNNSEIDVILRSKEKALGFEVKWANDVKPVHLIIGKMKEVYVLSKHTYNIKEKIIPLSIILVLLNI